MIPLLKQGWSNVKHNTKLWLILTLIVVFPSIYLYSFLQIQSIAYRNLESQEINKISALHDLIEAETIHGSGESTVLNYLASLQPDLRVLQIAVERDDGLIINYDLNSELIGTLIQNAPPYRSSLMQPGQSFFYNYVESGLSIKRAYRTVIVDATPYYIFTEHDYTNTVNRLKNRETDSYLYISLFFLFLIAVAYWLAKQINYQALYMDTKKEIEGRDLFTNSLAHELRAPLTSMRGYASMIEESTSDPTNREYASRINKSTARLILLINDFLEAARIQSGKLSMKAELTNLNEVITSVKNNASSVAETKGLKLLLDLPAEPISLTTDAKRLEQILTNLASNAIKYTNTGTVTFSLKDDTSEVTITIADTGRGISVEDQKKLFMPFVRVGDKASQESVTGTGLGMWITKKLVEQLGGKIGLESIKTVGTHVVIRLPKTGHTT